MSIGSFGGVTGSAAGAPLPAAQGSEAERAQRDSAAQTRATDFEKHAEQTAGVGHTEEDQETSDRDADGWRLWERNEQANADGEEGRKPKQAKDTTGDSGNALDLTG